MSGINSVKVITSNGEEKWIPFADLCFLIGRQNLECLGFMSPKEIEKLDAKYPRDIEQSGIQQSMTVGYKSCKFDENPPEQDRLPTKSSPVLKAPRGHFR